MTCVCYLAAAQEFGAALVELGLLKWIGPPPEGTVAAEAARADALMLQRLWRALTPAGEVDATLSSALLIDFMMHALSPEARAAEVRGLRHSNGRWSDQIWKWLSLS